MTFAVLERTFSPELPAPVSHEQWAQINRTLDHCLEARRVCWRISLVSVTGDRSICVFAAPHTEAIRAACREAQMPFQAAWPAEQWAGQQPLLQSGASLIVAEATYQPPITKDSYNQLKEQGKGCLKTLGIQTTCSFIALDGSRSVCTFLAVSAEDVRSLFRKFKIPFERVWKAVVIQPEAF